MRGGKQFKEQKHKKNPFYGKNFSIPSRNCFPLWEIEQSLLCWGIAQWSPIVQQLRTVWYFLRLQTGKIKSFFLHQLFIIKLHLQDLKIPQNQPQIQKLHVKFTLPMYFYYTSNSVILQVTENFTCLHKYCVTYLYFICDLSSFILFYSILFFYFYIVCAL